MWLVGLAVLASFGAVVPDPGARTGVATSPPTVQWFQTVEQALMDSIGPGDKSVWERVMDPSCLVTSEEGQVLTRQQFLDQLRPLPQGLTGGITVKDMTVQEFPTFAVVRYLADEWESVFSQRLTTQYRVTDTFRRDSHDWKMVASHSAGGNAGPTSASCVGRWLAEFCRYVSTAPRRLDLHGRVA
jgi:hypothetical protein